MIHLWFLDKSIFLMEIELDIQWSDFICAIHIKMTVENMLRQFHEAFVKYSYTSVVVTAS